MPPSVPDAPLTSSSQSRSNSSSNPDSSKLTAKASSTKILNAQKRLRSDIFEFDMSDMVDTRGGFLLEEDDLKCRKFQRRQKSMVVDPPISLDPNDRLKCVECATPEIDHQFHSIFKVLVCWKCKKDFPEKYSLITKTEAKEDYLLTDSELKDTVLLPHITKPNPRKNTWNDMYLYLRMQVEAFAIKRWGSLEAMDKEFERRQEEKKEKKEKKFRQKLNDLRKRTRVSIWQDKPVKNVNTIDHEHEYGESKCVDQEKDQWVQECKICGITIEVEEF